MLNIVLTEIANLFTLWQSGFFMKDWKTDLLAIQGEANARIERW